MAPSKTPIQITDLKAVVRARGLTGAPIALPAGRYLITGSTPDGRQWATTEAVEIAEGTTHTIQLRSDIDQALSEFPAEAEREGVQSASSDNPAAAPLESIGGARNDVGPSEESQAATQFALWKGQWLESWMGKRAEAPSEQELRHPSAPLRMLRADEPLQLSEASGTDVLIEIPEGQGASYFAVPFDSDPKRVTTVSLATDSAGKPTARFAFGSTEIDELLEYVTHGHAESARTISEAVVRHAEDSMNRSPLLAIVGSYVLLRANELDGLDRWTERLLAMAGGSIPDAHVLHAETLARLGRHAEAVRVLTAQKTPRMPWFRSGVGYLCQRLELYLKLPEARSGSLSLSDDQRASFARTIDGINRVSGALDEMTSFCVYRRMPWVTT